MDGSVARGSAAELAALSRIAPNRAGDLAFRRFCTPRQWPRWPENHQELSARARYHLRNAGLVRVRNREADLQAYVFEPDVTPARGAVLLVHGWTSEASFMMAFTEPLRRSGFRVVAFDFPAHGKSAGRCTNLAACARAMLRVVDALGPFDAVVAHSFGGLVALLVAEGGPPMPHTAAFQKMVLVATPNRLGDMTLDFGRTLGLTPAAQRAYEAHICRVGHRPLATFSAVELLKSCRFPVLVIHSRDDDEVPFAHAEQIVAAAPAAELAAFEGLGHRKVLYAPPVTRRTMKYVAER
ncbi:MAG: alpha/beta fold hydrolase [Hyphomicrobiaceae bacterium]|nr:alpha/beta fold hydrolase [Hyphomicrobiaceae bacterium]